ncbi:zinc-ribbon and DUF3426 domain-containing protein [Comamonas sp. NLF-1-9]|uniref:zinc-ribbon and DUF3426 domain-containing protein n=1 Tax=Comamonas sp. NLF-1-9 TaxID=2853163 RepID=UPI001C45E7F0|nr:zinc-ribbon and DUF3426 domain-containing protein [Comamonas sp. NLF-1-9]QXL85868.1 zinc-ribbon domain-containing protein [Comamonas sp. NLF-1-9]
MSQITRCPHCKTSFKVVSDQLRLAEGWVRCGRCKEIFDAFEGLVEDFAPASAAEPLLSLPPEFTRDTPPPAAAAARATVAAPGLRPAADALAHTAGATGWRARLHDFVPGTGAAGPTQAEAAAPRAFAAPDSTAGLFANRGAARAAEPAHEAAADVPQAPALAPLAQPQSQEDAAARAPAPPEPEPRSPPDADRQASVLAAQAEALQARMEPTWDETLTPGPQMPEQNPAAPGPDPEPDIELEPEPEPERRPEHEAEMQAGSDSELESGPEPEAEAEPESELDSKPEPESEDTAESLVSAGMQAQPPWTLEPQPHTARQSEAFAPAGQAASARAPAAQTQPPPSARPDADDFDFVRSARRKAFWRRPLVRGFLFLVLLALVGLLSLQLALHERDRIAASYPEARPWLERLCAPLACRVAPLRRIADVVIEGSSFVRQNAGDASYALQLLVRNNAPVALAMPAFELTLLDAQEQPVLRRVLSVQELDAPVELAPHGEWSGSLQLRLHADAARVSGYRLLAFYP